jgi:hypothetical protein
MILLNKNWYWKRITTYIIYFQGIRWTLPNLAEIIKSLQYIDIKYADKDMRLSFGKLTFDLTSLNDLDIPDDFNYSGNTNYH